MFLYKRVLSLVGVKLCVSDILEQQCVTACLEKLVTEPMDSDGEV